MRKYLPWGVRTGQKLTGTPLGVSGRLGKRTPKPGENRESIRVFGKTTQKKEELKESITCTQLQGHCSKQPRKRFPYSLMFRSMASSALSWSPSSSSSLSSHNKKCLHHLHLPQFPNIHHLHHHLHAHDLHYHLHLHCYLAAAIRHTPHVSIWWQEAKFGVVMHDEFVNFTCKFSGPRFFYLQLRFCANKFIT